MRTPVPAAPRRREVRTPYKLCTLCASDLRSPRCLEQTNCRDLQDGWKDGFEKGMAHAISVLERVATERADGRTYTPIGVGTNALRREMGWEEK